jgi:hypothetical protein
MSRVISKKRSKSDMLKAQKLSVRAQEGIENVELEGTEEFAQCVMVDENPAVVQAKRKKIAYTIAKDGMIIEVQGRVETTIGVLKEKDITIPRGTVYTLAKN